MVVDKRKVRTGIRKQVGGRDAPLGHNDFSKQKVPPKVFAHTDTGGQRQQEHDHEREPMRCIMVTAAG